MPKLKNLESPEADFFALDLGAEGERHEGKDLKSRSLIGHESRQFLLAINFLKIDFKPFLRNRSSKSIVFQIHQTN